MEIKSTVLFCHSIQIVKIVCVTEHWKSKEQLIKHKIEGFRLISSYCRLENEHGGAAVYIREELDGKELKNINRMSIKGIFEGAADQCFIGKESIVVVSVYRGKNDIDTFLSSTLKTGRR